MARRQLFEKVVEPYNALKKMNNLAKDSCVNLSADNAKLFDSLLYPEDKDGKHVSKKGFLADSNLRSMRPAVLASARLFGAPAAASIAAPAAPSIAAPTSEAVPAPRPAAPFDESIKGTPREGDDSIN